MNYKMKSFKFSTIILPLCTFSFYGVFSSYLLFKTNNSSLISILFGYILSLPFSYLILSVFKNKTELTYTKKIKESFPKISIIINTISILTSLFGYLLITYRLTTFLSNQYLVNTPRYLISLLIIILTYYTSSKGIQTIIKISYITFFYCILNFLFDFFTLLPQINIENFFPIINVDIKSIIISSIIFSSYFIIPVIYINIIPMNKLKDKNNFTKWYYIMIIISFIIIFLSVFTCIGVNGSNIIRLFDYPIYSTLKRIKLFNALDSLENVSISAWFLFIINTSNTMLYYIMDTFKETFKSKKKIFNFIILIIIFSIQNFIFSNNNFNESYEYIYIPIIFLAITLFIMIITLIKIKRT